MTHTSTPTERENAPEPRRISFQVEMHESMAYALAELCKRIGWMDAERLAVNEREAQLMLDATCVVRAALRDAGVSVR